VKHSLERMLVSPEKRLPPHAAPYRYPKFDALSRLSRYRSRLARARTSLPLSFEDAPHQDAGSSRFRRDGTNPKTSAIAASQASPSRAHDGGRSRVFRPGTQRSPVCEMAVKPIGRLWGTTGHHAGILLKPPLPRRTASTGIAEPWICRPRSPGTSSAPELSPGRGRTPGHPRDCTAPVAGPSASFP
jgi:hypothetical protein